MIKYSHAILPLYGHHITSPQEVISSNREKKVKVRDVIN